MQVCWVAWHEFLHTMMGPHASCATFSPHPDPGNSSEDDDDDDGDVNGWITLGFALGNILFDSICLLNFFKSHKQTGRDQGQHAASDRTVLDHCRYFW